MQGRLRVLVALLVTVSSVFAATELPEADDYESFEVEPPPLLPNRTPDPSQSSDVSGLSSPGVADLEKKLERAKRSAAGADQLFKRGILSKVEAESRALRVVRIEADLEKARLEEAKTNYEVQQTRVEKGEMSKEILVDAGHNIEAAKQTADSAAADRERAEIAAAEINLRRQQKLSALGSARRSDVARAEQKLADLKAGKN